jgi:hypothetical protein
MDAIDAIVEAWCARDRSVAFLPSDHAVIDATRGPRALVVEGVVALRGVAGAARDEESKDLLHACAVLGRIFAERGGSPTLAASSIDTLRDEVAALDAATAGAARAALAEGFAAARAEAARAEASAQWDFPACGVPLEGSGIAIAAGYPDDDEDALAAWASRVANGVARAGYRRAILAGNARACALLEDALSLAGVKVRTTSPPAPLRPARS